MNRLMALTLFEGIRAGLNILNHSDSIIILFPVHQDSWTWLKLNSDIYSSQMIHRHVPILLFHFFSVENENESQFSTN